MGMVSLGMLMYGLIEGLHVEGRLREEIPRNPLPPKTTIFFGTVVAIEVMRTSASENLARYNCLDDKRQG